MCLEILLQNSFQKNLISKNVDTKDGPKNRINRDQGVTTLNSQIVQFYEQKREFFLFRLYYIVIIMVVFWKQVVHARFYLLFTTQHFIFIRRVGDKSWEDRLVMIQPSHHIFSSLGVYQYYKSPVYTLMSSVTIRIYITLDILRYVGRYSLIEKILCSIQQLFFKIRIVQVGIYPGYLNFNVFTLLLKRHNLCRY